MVSDEDYMRMALELAVKGLGRTSPNPPAGCVIVKNGRIVGRGYHKRVGEPHAEVNALADAGKKARGGIMYVTLEPCCHFGRTGPCTQSIIEAGIVRVVAATPDPNAKMCGKGCQELRDAGVEVEVGLMEDAAKKLIEGFEKYITTGTPFVVAKAALTLDGRMAAKDGNSKWITSEDARRVNHEFRNTLDAVMVGVNTVIRDNPLLTCRIPGGRNPVRIIVDSQLRTPLKSKVLRKGARTMIATTRKAPKSKIALLRKKGVEVIVTHATKKGVDLKQLMLELGAREITSVLIEGGGQLLGSAFDADIVDKVAFFFAPKILGDGYMIRGGRERELSEAVELEWVEGTRIEDDFLITGYVKKE